LRDRCGSRYVALSPIGTGRAWPPDWTWDKSAVNTRNLITILSMMVLVGTEVFAVAIAAGWALAGLFDLGDTVGHVLMAVFSVGAAWVMLQLWRRATSIEPLRDPAAKTR
jgi:hypothetical protein